MSLALLGVLPDMTKWLRLPKPQVLGPDPRAWLLSDAADQSDRAAAL